MCYFITIAIPSPLSAEVHRRHFRRDRRLDATANPSAIAAAGPGFTPFLITAGGCSCAWYKPPGPSPQKPPLDRRIKHWQKRGWSRAKIDRALASMEREPHPDDGLHPAIIELVNEIMAAAPMTAVALWVHFFSANVETEPYTLTGQIECALDALPSAATSLSPDTRLLITALPL